MSATETSHARLVAAEPALTRIAPLGALVPGLPPRTLLHAGPPFADRADLPAPVLNAAVAAALHEHWAEDRKSARAAIASVDIALRPAQDHGVVTPLAFVAGPSMFALEVADPVSGVRRFSPLNDGPPPHALRLGTGRDEGIALVRALTEGVGADLAAALSEPLPLIPAMAAALAEGDDLHGRVSAAQSRVRGFLREPLSPGATAYLERANQFVLNVIMAACATMMAAGAGVAGSRMVVAAGGNGRDFGWKLANAPDQWIVRPASVPVGPRFPGQEAATALPAIGDSAVIDAVGFGAACQRFAPELAQPLEGHVDPAFGDAEAHAAYIGPHPAFPDGVRVGLDLDRPRRVLGIMLGMVGADGESGLVGRGIAPWPEG